MDLQQAAELYVKERMTIFPFPQNTNDYRLLMEIAFMEGGQWQAKKDSEFLYAAFDKARGQKLKSEEGLINAQF